MSMNNQLPVYTFCLLLSSLLSGCVWDEPEHVKVARKEIRRFEGEIIGGNSTSIPGIVITGRDVSAITWEKILPLQSLFMINLSGTNFSDEDVDVLRTSPHLHRVHLSHTEITDAGVAQLSQMYQIRELYLQGCNISDACVSDLLRMENLDYVVLYETHITDEAAARLGDKADHSTTASEEVRQALVGLERGNCATVSTSAFQQGLTGHVKYLVEFTNPPTVNEDAIIGHLKTLANSGELDVRIIGDEMTSILRRLPYLEALDILTESDEVEFNSGLLDDLKQVHANLVYVNVGQLDAKGYEGVGAVLGMRQLILGKTQITPQAWAKITSSPTLQQLEFQECTFQGIDNYKVLDHSIKIDFVNCDNISDQVKAQILSLANK